MKEVVTFQNFLESLKKKVRKSKEKPIKIGVTDKTKNKMFSFANFTVVIKLCILGLSSMNIIILSHIKEHPNPAKISLYIR